MNDLERATPSDLLWEVRYAPKTIDELLIPTTIKNQLKDGNLRNFLFYGQAGTGKTSTALILGRGRTVKFIDCSSNRRISMIRDDISDFCEIASIDGVGKKLIILDEIDALPKIAQQALRGTIEKYEPVARFIGTCNYPENILGPILSRFSQINYDLPDKKDRTEQVGNYVRRIREVCNENNLTIDDIAMTTLIKKHYPDMRKILQILQDCHDSGVQIITDKDIAKTGAGQQDDAFEIIINEQSNVKLYKYFSAWRTKENTLITSLQSNFASYIWNRYREQYGDKLGDIAIISHRYGVESKQSIDMFVTMLAYVSELSKLFTK